MKKGIFSEIQPVGQLGLFLLIMVVSLLIFALIGGLIGFIFTDISISSVTLTDYSNPNTISYLKFTQIFQAIGLFVIPPLVAAFIFGKLNENYLHFKTTSFLSIIISAFLMIIALPIINWLAEFNQSLSLPEALTGIEEWMHNQELAAESITKHFLHADSILVLIVNLFMMALLPAIGEELVFRGVLQKLFTQMSKNTHIAIWVTAFFFSAIHMQFFTFLPRFFMGAMFGYMLVWSGSIWLPITAHFVNNGLAVVSSYLIQQKTLDKDFENLGTDNSSTWVVISILIVGSLMFYLKKQKLTSNS